MQPLLNYANNKNIASRFTQLLLCGTNEPNCENVIFKFMQIILTKQTDFR